MKKARVRFQINLMLLLATDGYTITNFSVITPDMYSTSFVLPRTQCTPAAFIRVAVQYIGHTINSVRRSDETEGIS
jgi:hypothetical protein